MPPTRISSRSASRRREPIRSPSTKVPLVERPSSTTSHEPADQLELGVQARDPLVALERDVDLVAAADRQPLAAGERDELLLALLGPEDRGTGSPSRSSSIWRFSSEADCSNVGLSVRHRRRA